MNGWTQAPAAIVIGPLVVSKTVYGSIRAVSWMKSRSAGPTRASGRQVAVAHADLPLGGEVAGEVVGVPGDEVPGAVDPLAAQLDARRAAATSSNQCVDAVRARAPTASLGPDQGAGGLAVAEAQPGAVRVGRRRSPAGGHPAAVGHHHRAPRQPVAIVDRHVRVALALDGRQVRADHRPPPLRTRADPERLGDLVAQRAATQQQVIAPDGSASVAQVRRRRSLQPGKDA